MKIALNPITNTKSNNPNQVNFKARAELRLSEAFFAKLAGMTPAEAANRAQGIMDVMAVLESHAPGIGKAKDVMVLRDYDAPKLLPDWIEQLEIKYYEYTCRYKEKDLYNEKPIEHPDVLSSNNIRYRTVHLKDKLYRLLGRQNQISIPELEDIPSPFYGSFNVSEGDTLTRKKYTYSDLSREQVAAGNLPVASRTETTTLANLMKELKALCTPPERQVNLEEDNVSPVLLLKVEERGLEWGHQL